MSKLDFGPALGMASMVSMVLAAPAWAAAPAATNQDKTQAYIDGVTAAGMTCDLNAMTLRASDKQRDVVEFGCANGDVRIATFSTATPMTVSVYNCVTARIIQFGCSTTKESTAYPLITADIRKLDNSTRCTVDAARLMGAAANGKSAYLEVGCTESALNGQVIQYDTASLRPMALVDCGVVTTTMAGGCKLAGAQVNMNLGLQDQSMSTATGGQLGGFDRSALMTPQR